MHSYPRLREDLDCDVLVVGAGITGALIADALSGDGLQVAVIDRREAGWGSTAASTALLQYEIDVELHELAGRIGLRNALLAYRACEAAVKQLLAMGKRLRGVDVARAGSLYLATRARHVGRLRDEAALRRAHGFVLRELEAAELEQRYGIEAPFALLTPTAARVDPYRMTHALLARIARRGARVHGRTELAAFEAHRGRVVAVTADDRTITCQHLVVAAGYECQAHLDERVARNRSTYAFVSEPLERRPFGGELLLWEAARPYLYLRTTTDDRVIVGGEDDGIDLPARRDAKVEARCAKLQRRCRELLPGLALRSAFAWGGTFAETDDGLPFFGPHPQHGPRVHFAMAYGGNGITYSVIGARILLDRLRGRTHPCARLFSFARPDSR